MTVKAVASAARAATGAIRTDRRKLNQIKSGTTRSQAHRAQCTTAESCEPIGSHSAVACKCHPSPAQIIPDISRDTHTCMHVGFRLPHLMLSQRATHELSSSRWHRTFYQASAEHPTATQEEETDTHSTRISADIREHCHTTNNGPSPPGYSTDTKD